MRYITSQLMVMASQHAKPHMKTSVLTLVFFVDEQHFHCNFIQQSRRYIARKNINPEAVLLLEFYSLPNNPMCVKEFIIQNAE